MKKSAVFIVCVAVLPLLFAQTVFSGLDINAENRLLFTASYTNLLSVTEKTLFTATVTAAKPAVITCSPEKMESLDGGKTLQLRNWYGTARYNTDSDSLTWISQSPFFVDGTPASTMTVEPVSVSPDGLWTVTFKKTATATGMLVLFDVKKAVSVTLAIGLNLDLQEVPVRWAPDSSLFVYEKPDGLYFAKPSQLFVSNPLADRYRKLGSGTIYAVNWTSAEHLVYMRDNTVFAVSASELQIRALYAGFVQPGKLIGTTSCKFDSRSDRFWSSADISSLVIVQRNRTVMLLNLSGTDFLPVRQLTVQPFVAFKENVLSVQTFRYANQNPILWVESLEGGKIVHRAFRFSATGLTSLYLPAGAREPQLSPDKSQIAFNSDSGLFVYTLDGWLQKAVFSSEPIRCFVWESSESLYVAGAQTVRRWNVVEASAPVLFLSRADAYGWNPSGQKIIAATVAGFFEYVPETNVWKPTTEPMRAAQAQNARYRVFIEGGGVLFSNSIYARAIEGVSATWDIFAANARPALVKMPEKKLALAFDALDNADGLAAILKTLKEYSITASFFINGEFIQRYPQAVREITADGHQCGSMFYTNYDFSDPQFLADADFILKGLARTEEEFFAVTGRDLSPLWHTPNYIVNSNVRSIAEKAGYSYVERSFAPLDWVSLETGIAMPGLYLSSQSIIESVAVSLKNGMILPLTVGLPSGVRFDYVYDNLDVLIQAILSAGYRIVPISGLLKTR